MDLDLAKFLDLNKGLLDLGNTHIASENDESHKQDFNGTCLFISSQIRFTKELIRFCQDFEQQENFEIRYFDYSVKTKNKLVRLPEWSPMRFLGIDFLGPVVQVRSRIIHDLKIRNRIDLNEFIVLNSPRVELKKINVGTIFGDLQVPSAADRITAFGDYFNSNKIGVTLDKQQNLIHIDFARSAPKKISVIIPTAGKTKNTSTFLAECMISLLEQNLKVSMLEIILIYDNKGNLDYLEKLPETQNSQISIKKIPFNGEFNFSKKCNIGAEASSGHVLIFLNDDVVLKSKNSILELSGAAQLPNIGAVGSKLKFADGSIQHGGIFVSEASFGHAYFGEPDITGIAGDLSVAHEVIGVTGACLAIDSKVFTEVGKWNVELPNSYNDVEFCLRLINSGRSNFILNNLWIEHFGSATRKSITTKLDRSITLKAIGKVKSESFLREAKYNLRPTSSRNIFKLIMHKLVKNFN